MRDAHYNFKAIEAYWQQEWQRQRLFCVTESADKSKYWILDMFPYPSAAGLHVGHIEGYTATDVLGRYKRACGFNVLHAMGWDAFGLPAEQNAIATGVHPSINTQNNINAFRKQIQRVGIGIDWSREIDTTAPSYYRWTQWIFLQFFKHGLAHVENKPVWWCPKLGTVLANEEVIDGKSERGHYPVERRALRQWVLNITAYADKLLDGLAQLHWPEATLRQQKLWIGRSKGARVKFQIPNGGCLEVFTTRPDTLFGVSFIAIAPEHPAVSQLTTDEQRAAVQAYQASIAAKSDLERTDLAKNKTGVFTGSYAMHPLTHEPIPVWVADYVLMYHGTGAVMGVPAHDTRDYAFAQMAHLPIVPVIQAEKESPLPFCEPGVLIHSHEFSGLPTDEAQERITQALVERQLGEATVQYKLHDWLFSRQRYWGEPFPIIWVKEVDYQRLLQCKNSPLHEFLPIQPVTYEADGMKFYAVPLTSQHLPVTLPKVDSYQPTEGSTTPLQNADPQWLNIRINLATGAIEPGVQGASTEWIEGSREINTMPQWAGSCWYYLRYLSPHNKDRLVDPKALAYWGTPDLYVGGAEHAVLHLLYARFWHHFLFDIGVVPTSEPFTHLFHPGIILGADGNKMSKSLGNVINPNDIVDQYGADALRLYELFMGPLESSKPWSTQNIEGVARFLNRLWRTCIGPDGELSKNITQDEPSDDSKRLLHESIQKVTDAIERLRFNTAISQLMICLNGFQKEATIPKQSMEVFLQLLAPFAPHITEELWHRCGRTEAIVDAPWPKADSALCVSRQLNIPIQVNGKLRGMLVVQVPAQETEVIQAAKADAKVAPYLEQKTLIRTVYVPNKLVNFVVK